MKVVSFSCALFLWSENPLSDPPLILPKGLLQALFPSTPITASNIPLIIVLHNRSLIIIRCLLWWLRVTSQTCLVQLEALINVTVQLLQKLFNVGVMVTAAWFFRAANILLVTSGTHFQENSILMSSERILFSSQKAHWRTSVHLPLREAVLPT